MSSLHDLPLPIPLGEGLYRWLLFGAFLVHFVFVLLTIGTGILGVTWYLRRRFSALPAGDARDQDVLRAFFVYKSLAIVWGVAPLLLFQLFNPVPFFTAVNLTAPLWMMVIVLLIVALLLLELLAERKGERPGLNPIMAVVGLATLLAVPGIFVLLLTTVENPQAWPAMLAREGALPRGLSVHWAFRLLHVLGAAVVFAAAMNWIRTPRAQAERRASLVQWMLGALLIQVIGGVALYATVRPAPGALPAILVLTGAASAGILLWRIARAQREESALQPRAVIVLLLLVLTPMLLNRQVLQDRIVRPMAVALAANARAYQARLAPWQGEAVGTFNVVSQVTYDDPLTVYTRSCGFCHGAVANGEGREAPNLSVPPENLAALRTSREELLRILTTGVHGTAMPYFGIYVRGELDGLLGFLSENGWRTEPERIRLVLPEEARLEAERVWSGTCATCHGAGGRGTALSATFAPPPPDLTRLSFAPWYLQKIVTEGYRGTRMPAFGHLPVETRWALVEKVQTLYGAAPLPD